MVVSSRALVRAILIWAAITLAFSGAVIALAGKLYAQEIGCYSITRFDTFPCIPGSPEMFVQEAHDGYEKWMQPPQPMYSCCNKQDCQAVEGRFDEKRGIYQALIEGEWVDIPPEIILDPKKPENVNPDGSYHACWNRSTKKLLCFREAEPKI